MIERVDFDKPVYNAVNISIRKPEVNAGSTTNPLEVNNDRGIYNAVKINIDKPQVNTQPKKIYDYPQADSIVTYEMLNLNRIPMQVPASDYIAEEVPIEDNEPTQEKTLSKDSVDTDKTEAETENIEIPAPNYTTLETEKAVTDEPNENVTSQLSFHGAENNVKRPEIIPSENILPKIDITAVSNNLKSADKDVQAKQIEEIVKSALTDKENAKNYLVSDVFTDLINITKEDVTKLAAPTKQQIEARQKLIANIMAVEKDRNAINNLPYKMSDDEIAMAANLSPMELAERNKEYAITALGALAKLFIDDYEAKEGRVVPITDAPGVSAIVDALRKDPDPSVKLTAIDALRYIKRPDYKEDLSALFALAQNDPNPHVARAAALSIQELNK